MLALILAFVFPASAAKTVGVPQAPRFETRLELPAAGDLRPALDLAFDRKTAVGEPAAPEVLLARLPGETPIAVEEGKAPFEEDIEAFEAADRVSPPPKKAVLFIGSSSIRFWASLGADFDGTPVINRGFGGSHIADVTRFEGRIVAPYEPRQIVLYAGDNDIADGKTPQQVLSAFKDFVAKVDASLPSTPIVFVSIKPSPARAEFLEKAREANRLVRGFAQRRGIGFVDVFTPMLDARGKPREELFGDDGLHMNRAGYELWTKLIAPTLKPRQAPRGPLAALQDKKS